MYFGVDLHLFLLSGLFNLCWSGSRRKLNADPGTERKLIEELPTLPGWIAAGRVGRVGGEADVHILQRREQLRGYAVTPSNNGIYKKMVSRDALNTFTRFKCLNRMLRCQFLQKSNLKRFSFCLHSGNIANLDSGCFPYGYRIPFLGRYTRYRYSFTPLGLMYRYRIQTFFKSRSRIQNKHPGSAAHFNAKFRCKTVGVL
jgi:hypothetical protein